jgi:ribosomal protein S14
MISRLAGAIEGKVHTLSTTVAAEPLTATDRCDRCGAQAYVRATMESGLDLVLCAHHFRENEAALRETASSIHDETTRLADVSSTAALEER